jgi:hypothetical protein
MDVIRPFLRDDIPRVADLHARVFSQTGGLAPGELRAQLHDVFFQNPWYDGSLPSLVYAEGNERIVGFLGIVPRPMTLNGRPILAAISTQFMVDPSRRGLPGVRLLKTFLSGPQDLSMTDGATELTRKVWEGLGGARSILYSLHWTRPLRPSRYIVSLLGGRKVFRPVISGARPICGVVDALAARMRASPFRLIRQSPQEELSVEALLACLSEFPGKDSLRPEYDEYSLKWLVEKASQKRCWGDLRKVVVRDAEGEITGWYLYYVKRGATGEVLQIAARPAAIDRVLDHLFYHAWRQGAIAISGRLEPRFLSALVANRCFLHGWGPATLVHSRDPGLLEAVHQGDAFLTRMEGEWWMRFQGG